MSEGILSLCCGFFFFLHALKSPATLKEEKAQKSQYGFIKSEFKNYIY